MKHFSKHWKSSKNPRKQRKYYRNAPLHLRKKFVSCNLSRDLRKKYNRRNVPVRKGDKVRVMTGQFRNRSGKVNKVDKKKLRVYIDGIEIVKKDGTKRFCPVHTSNVQLVELTADDKRRKELLERRVKK